MKTILFNPYTGTPRHPGDIKSDPQGLLIVEPDAPMLAAPQPAQEPFAYFNPNVKTQIMGAAERDRYAGRTDGSGMVAYAKACTAPLYTTPQAPQSRSLGALAKRRIFDAIRGAYDLGYNDARNARTTPGDSAPGYKGRDVEADHGGALLSALNQQLAHGITKGPAA